MRKFWPFHFLSVGALLLSPAQPQLIYASPVTPLSSLEDKAPVRSLQDKSDKKETVDSHAVLEDVHNDFFASGVLQAAVYEEETNAVFKEAKKALEEWLDTYQDVIDASLRSHVAAQGETASAAVRVDLTEAFLSNLEGLLSGEEERPEPEKASRAELLPEKEKMEDPGKEDLEEVGPVILVFVPEPPLKMRERSQMSETAKQIGKLFEDFFESRERDFAVPSDSPRQIRERAEDMLQDFISNVKDALDMTVENIRRSFLPDDEAESLAVIYLSFSMEAEDFVGLDIHEGAAWPMGQGGGDNKAAMLSLLEGEDGAGAVSLDALMRLFYFYNFWENQHPWVFLSLDQRRKFMTAGELRDLAALRGVRLDRGQGMESLSRNLSTRGGSQILKHLIPLSRIFGSGENDAVILQLLALNEKSSTVHHTQETR